MKSPLGIEFASDSQRVLTHSLLAVKPQEGCDLLIGDERQSSSFKEAYILRIQMIWPCCNVWESENFKFLFKYNMLLILLFNFKFILLIEIFNYKLIKLVKFSIPF